jgi:hypothetical protein
VNSTSRRSTGNILLFPLNCSERATEILMTYSPGKNKVKSFNVSRLMVPKQLFALFLSASFERDSSVSIVARLRAN